MGGAAQILMYHRVVDTDTDPWLMCVSPERFEQQLAAIRRVGTPLSLDEFLLAAREDSLPPRAIVLTFDDGYLDNLTEALPRLRAAHMPATLYVTTANVGSQALFWWDRLEDMLLGPELLPAQLRLALPDGPVQWDLGDAARFGPAQRGALRGIPAWSAPPATRLHFFYAVWAALWPLPHAQRELALAQVADWCAAATDAGAGRRTMDEEELRAMRGGGLVTIGAHSIDHPPLPAHPEDEQRRQIAGSRARLEAIVGEPVRHFAYPHGEYAPATIALLRAEGFASATTVEQRLAGADADPMLLPRFGVKDVDGDAFAAELEARFLRHEQALHA